ncbi:MAG: putative quinol monooxygenase [Bacteroidia bacterium]|nr:putative quinol monooxygenase [Bacteroidia bacterium]
MKQQVFLFCATVLMLLCTNSGVVKAQTQPEPHVILVEFIFDETKLDEAIDLLSELQMQTLENEEGCLVYDVLLSEEEPTKIFIYESYENEAAFKAHTNSAHYKEILSKKLKPLIKQEKITKVFPLNFEGQFSDAEF